MSSLNAPQIETIAIIGGGLGGLALAQALQNSGLKVTVYERDVSPAGRSQGFLIGLNEDLGIKALRSLKLPYIDEFLDTLEPRGFVVLTSSLRLLARFGVAPESPDDKSAMGITYLVDRWKLREILTKNINIVWNKKFDHYEEHENVVHAFFEDNTSITADILIGADGSKSAIRKQRVPQLKLEEVPIFNSGGFLSTPDKSIVPTLLSYAKKDGIRILGPNGYSFLMFNYLNQKQEQEFLWALTYPKFSPLLEQLQDVKNPDRMKAAVQEAAKDFHVEVRSVIERTPTEKMTIYSYYLNTVFSSKKNPFAEYSQRPRVTLLGDAAHLMTSHRGLGANTAFQDSVDLAQALVDPDWTNALTKYEEILFERGAWAVQESRNSSNGLMITGFWRTTLRNGIFWVIGCIMGSYRSYLRLRSFLRSLIRSK